MSGSYEAWKAEQRESPWPSEPQWPGVFARPWPAPGSAEAAVLGAGEKLIRDYATMVARLHPVPTDSVIKTYLVPAYFWLGQEAERC